MLWGRAANRCAFPDCRRRLVIDATETDDESLVGDACHIVGAKTKGPRGKSPLTAAQRDKYSNLILLCKIHHKQVDDQRGTYAIDVLHRMKEQHEAWVNESLEAYDPEEQRDRELYADYIDQWAARADLDEWRAWTSYLLSAGQPELRVEKNSDLLALREWLLTRIWPRRYSALEMAFENFRMVLSDLQETFREHAEKDGDLLFTRKFYKIDDWDEELYRRLFVEYEQHVDVVQDLTLELTRAANYVCDQARRFVDRSYRMQEGVLLVESGPGMDLKYRLYRPEYRGDQRSPMPYPGLEQFSKIRANRDVSFGGTADE